MLEKQFILPGNPQLNVAVLGDGPPLVLLHGVLRSWQDFSTILPSLANRFRVYALDFRAHGRSEVVACDFRVHDYLADAMALLRHIGPAPSVVIGHSLGAMVAAGLAAEMPESVRAIILEDPPFESMGTRIGDTSLLNYFQQLHRLTLAGLPVAELAQALAEIRLQAPGSRECQRLGDIRDAATLRFAAECLRHVDPTVLRPIIDGTWLVGYDLDDVFRKINCPILLLQANDQLGGMCIDADVARIQSLARNVTHVLIEDAGHHIHWQRPEVTLRLIDSFLDSLPTVTAGHEIPAPHRKEVFYENGLRHTRHSQRQID